MLSLWERFVHWKQAIGHERQLRFPWWNGTQIYQDFLNRKLQTAQVRNNLFPWDDWSFSVGEEPADSLIDV